MSLIELFNQLPKLDCLKTTEKLVLLCLKWHCGGNGHCWPSVDTLAKEVGAERKTIFRSLRRLEDLGFIKRGKRGRNSNTYELSSPKLGTTKNVTSDKKGTTVGSKTELQMSQKGDDLNKNKENKNKKKKDRTPKGVVAHVTEEFARSQAESVDKERYRKQFSGYDIDQEYADFIDYYFEKLDDKRRPNWMKWKWTSGNAVFSNFLRRPWKKPKPGQDPTPEQSRKQHDEMDAERQRIEAERAKEEVVWTEIRKLEREAFEHLRQQGLEAAKKQTPGMRPPEVVVKINMIQIFKAEKDKLNAD